LRQILEDLRGCGADLKVVPAANLHLTLKFLGDIPDTQAPLILAKAREAGFPTGYRVDVRGLGAFPDWKKMNVVWAGISDDESALARSFALSERLFAELGLPTEPRPFTPHLTIARKRSDRDKERAKAVMEPHRSAAFGEVAIEGPVLFRSHLSSDGPTYERLGGVVA
jgi:RNA 2',3'-cyclic 3'-phosphodiesterase